MSWFWRTPSILARSLMREAAPAFGTANAVSSIARKAALNVLVITLPNVTYDSHLLCERRANRPQRLKTLVSLRFLNRAAVRIAPTDRQERADRQVLPGLLPPINHNGAEFTVFGDRRRLGWGFQRCAFTDRTELRLLRRRPARAAAPAAHSASASRNRRAMPRLPARCARSRPSMR